MHLPTGISEFDRVLGGGLVAGSLVLIGGDPGIGKSTLLLQAMNHLARSTGKVLYVSGEESARQIKLRGPRMGVNAADLFILAETALENILLHIDQNAAQGSGHRFNSDSLYIRIGVCAGKCQPGS